MPNLPDPDPLDTRPVVAGLVVALFLLSLGAGIGAAAYAFIVEYLL